MKTLRKNGGFTLVELIVVIAILAILAGVAVPAYTGYIKKAEQAADMQVLSSVNTAVQGLAAAEGATVSKIDVTPSNATVNVTVTTDKDKEGVRAIEEAEVLELTGPLSFGESFKSATWTSATKTWTITTNK